MKAIFVIFFTLFGMAAGTVSAAPLMYVPTGESNEVVVIDLHTDRVVERIGELENAHGLAGNAKSRYLIAGSMQAPGSAESSPARPGDVSKAEHEAHHGGASGGRTASYVTIIDRRKGRVVRRIGVRGMTHHTAISPDGEFAIAVHSSAGGISIIDLDRLQVIKELDTGNWPNYAVFDRNGRRLYVSNTRDGTISVISTGDWEVLGEVDVGGEPEHMVISADGVRLYVVDPGAGKVREVTLSTMGMRNIYAVGKSPHAVEVPMDRRWLFVTVKGEDKLVRIDFDSGERRSIELKPAPYHLEYADVVGKLYVSSRTEPRIWVLDPRTLTVDGAIDLERGAGHQMVVIGE